MKRLPEKLMVGAIILSCGFVLQSEPTPRENKMKGAELRVKRMVAASQASMQTARAEEPVRRGDRISR